MQHISDQHSRVFLEVGGLRGFQFDGVRFERLSEPQVVLVYISDAVEIACQNHFFLLDTLQKGSV